MLFPDLFRDDVFTLETRRLFLRWPTAADRAQLMAEAGDQRVSEPSAAIPSPYKAADAMKFIAEARHANTEGQGIHLAITSRRDQDRLIGMVSLVIRPDGDIILGYWLGAAYWGKGYATEAAQTVLDVAFLYSESCSIHAAVRVMNDRSRKVLQRCGFQYVGSGMSHRPTWGDTVPVDEYRLARSTWTSLKGWRAPLPRDAFELRESA